MHNIITPVMNQILARYPTETLEMLKRLGVTKRVVICGLTTAADGSCDSDAAFATLQKNCEFLHKEGFEVCAWEWTWLNSSDEYTKFTNESGDKHGGFVCPSDEKYVQFSCEHRAKMAATGVDMLLFDDDFSPFGYYNPPISCCCDNHLRLISEKLGETVSRETLAEALINGGANKYRSAWIEVNADLQRNFARKIREAVNAVNPNCRIGICCSPSSWDYSADICELSRIIAGNTKPFLRLIGAPYWAVNNSMGGFRLQDVIEHERMVRSFCGDDIEIVSEGDAFPRPRQRCPATYMENFDMALRADGHFDGILKYGIEYTAKPDYETGYAEFHQSNAENCHQIETHFSKKDAQGVYVLEVPRKYENLEITEKITDDYLQHLMFSRASRMLATNTIPTAYRYSGYGTVAFGENAKYASEEVLNGGMILDIMAAKHLEKMGVDVGLKSIGDRVAPVKEYFLAEDDYVSVTRAYTEIYWRGKTQAYRAELKDGIQLQTQFVVGNQKIPGSYLYENAKGQRFLVFLFDGYRCGEPMFRMYARARQLQKAVRWLCGKDLPAICLGNPDLYMMCKADEHSLSVGLWNLFADPVLKPVITLNSPRKKIKFINCEGTLSGQTVTLSKLNANGFAGFVVE